MNTKGYKAFSHGMICRKGEPNEKQYAEHTTYEEQGGKICNEGMMHFCANPLDCLDYYPLIDDDGNFVEIAEVEALDEPVTDDNRKYATKKLHIGAKIDIKALGSILAQVIRESAERETKDVINGGDDAKQVGGNYANQVGGYAAKQVGGNYAKQVGGYAANQQAGENSVLVAAENSRFKAGLHSVVLHYWYDDDGNIDGFKAVQVDGVKIKADTWYELKDGEFAECESSN